MKRTKIFVTVGSTYPLDRLIKESNKFDTKKFEIFAQIGESAFEPKNIKWTKFLDYDKLQEKIKWADVIISHAGIGTIIDCLSQKKQLILFPRLKKYGEAVDDHQIEICKAFEKKYNIKWPKNEKGLEKILKKDRQTHLKKRNLLVKEIKGTIL